MQGNWDYLFLLLLSLQYKFVGGQLLCYTCVLDKIDGNSEACKTVGEIMKCENDGDTVQSIIVTGPEYSEVLTEIGAPIVKSLVDPDSPDYYEEHMSPFACGKHIGKYYEKEVIFRICTKIPDGRDYGCMEQTTEHFKGKVCFCFLPAPDGTPCNGFYEEGPDTGLTTVKPPKPDFTELFCYTCVLDKSDGNSEACKTVGEIMKCENDGDIVQSIIVIGPEYSEVLTEIGAPIVKSLVDPDYYEEHTSPFACGKHIGKYYEKEVIFRVCTKIPDGGDYGCIDQTTEHFKGQVCYCYLLAPDGTPCNGFYEEGHPDTRLTTAKPPEPDFTTTESGEGDPRGSNQTEPPTVEEIDKIKKRHRQKKKRTRLRARFHPDYDVDGSSNLHSNLFTIFIIVMFGLAAARGI